ncbi:hypothetical protein [Glutamicibacter sp.]|uniref:hypothetical protein n=1 Tax=Glutamicibacter sp. TaxID=1931995 RepID=UPI0028BDA2DA|nr:hypothetical protein [Glutamicibacter sp.]
MDVTELNSLILLVTATAVFFYVLFCVVRAAVKRGIIDAREYLGADQKNHSATED